MRWNAFRLGVHSAKRALRLSLRRSMRVVFTDPQGSMMWRVLPFLGPIATFFFACFGPFEGTASWMLAFTSLGALNLLGVLSFRQRKPRVAEVELRPGSIRIRNAGTRNQTIRARDIVGATTTRTRDGVLLTFQHALRDQPITLRVNDDAEADQIRRALGIGHGGFGSVAWRSIPNSSMRTMVGGSAIAGFSFFACVLFGLANIGVGVGVFGVAAFLAMFTSFFAWLGRGTEPGVVMTAEGLRLRTALGWFALPYEMVHAVTDHGRGLAFAVPPPYGQVGVECSGPAFGGLTKDDREIMIHQIEAAGQRARGLGPQKNDATARVDLLRRNGATARDWLTRLDMQGQMLSSTAGYRGNTLDTEDLWAILEDPEAEAELRTAAARVLSHSTHADARPRIAAAVAAVREDGTNKRLRIAVQEDVERASNELSTLEAEEQQAQYMRAFKRSY
jgi:hypothetical protein